MVSELSRLLLYRDMVRAGTIPGDASSLCARFASGASGPELTGEVCAFCSRLIALAEREGFSGNLWQAALALGLIADENPFSLACEGREEPGGTLSALARQDFERLLRCFRYDFSPLLAAADAAFAGAVLDYRPGAGRAKSAAARLAEALRDRLSAAADAEEAARATAEFYRCHGAGSFALNRAFRAERDGTLAPLRTESAGLDALVGYETQKRALRTNTEAFLAGRPANNVLLYGDAGTGKSTCVRSLLAEYPDSLLRVVELEKSRLDLLPAVAELLGRRRCRFLIFLDDLSFEENETEYKRLKAAIEGGLSPLPENVLICATSNRRHLIRETWKDRSDMEHDGDIHRSDTMEEKLSLSGRFGLRIFFPNPTFEEYHAIVRELAERRGMDPAALREAASAWQVRAGNRSGRTASQFVDGLSAAGAAAQKEKKPD